MTQFAEQLGKIKVIPVITLERTNQAIPLAEALYQNGLKAAEVTLRTDAAFDSIRLIRDAFPEMLVGAGTVVNPEQLRKAVEAGAQFAVSPGTNVKTLSTARELDIPFIPGVNNPTAIEMALNEGCNLLKFFPAEPSGGVNMLKALLAPYVKVQIMPTGGITPSNLNDYLALPQVLACGGTWMVTTELLAANNWAEVGRLAKEAAELASR